MVIFSSEYFQGLNSTGAKTYEVTSSGMSAENYTIYKTDDPSAITFVAGDKISLFSTVTNNTTQYTYIGSYAGGIVIQGVTSEGYTLGPYLFTDTALPLNRGFTVDTETPYPVCFVKGTLITTERGLVEIENLVEGDRVQGSTGWRTVKWIGFRHYGASAFTTEESARRIAPVCVCAHAIADNIPSRDLYVSAWHHLYVEGKLVRAGDLVNGVTIKQETHVTEVSYYHVELDQFDVIMAHGVYSESWADGGNRDFFQNADVTSLNPEDMQRRRASRPGFDHLVTHKGKALLTIQQHVADRAQAMENGQQKEKQVA
jgi:hypothetical protein